MQQVLAYESDLLEYGDLFEGSTVVEEKTSELVDAAGAELEWVLDGGGVFEMIDAMKGRLVQSNAERVRRIESGEQKVVGVNSFTETEPSPLSSLDSEHSIVVVDPATEREQIERLEQWRADRDDAAVAAALDRLRAAAETDENLVPVTVELARSGGTVGEWAATLRDVFGEYRAPTGVGAVAVPVGDLAAVRERVHAATEAFGGQLRLLVGKPGLDGHSNGAEQIAVAARDAGLEVIYQGIRLTPEQIAAVALDEDVDVIGLSILSGSHLELVPEVVRLCRERGVTAPVVAGGIIPEDDRPRLLAADVAAVYTPKDFELTKIMGEIVDLAIARRG
jgi:(2R)-ethylmalonyl-CoA mutase